MLGLEVPGGFTTTLHAVRRAVPPESLVSAPFTSRRDAIRVVGALLAARFLPGCGGGTRTMPTADSGPVPVPDASDDGGLPPTDAQMSRWAAGGTESMTDAATYPNPFSGSAGALCALTLPTTLGPCFYTSPERRDVSEGYTGLPMRLVLRIVDTACRPVAGARLDIWHTGNTGVYSGGPIPFCTGGDPDAVAHLYFRGSQISDADGLVSFDTCFPGAYDGRALHIHFQVFPAGAAPASIVSQLFFPQPLVDEIFASHPDYTPHGLPDTPNAADGIYLSVGEAAILEYAPMTDGAMLAWKEVVITG